MASNPLERAHEQAAKDTHKLGRLFHSVGSSERPNTEMLRAHKAATVALRATLGQRTNRIGSRVGSIPEIRRIMGDLRRDTKRAVMPILHDATREGHESALRQLAIYRLRVVPASQDMTEAVNAAYDVVDTTLQRREAAIVANVLAGADYGLIYGDETRQGLMLPFEIVGAAAFWIASLFWGSFSNTAGDVLGTQTKKQAVAGLDERTTDCCLRVHGQVVDFSAKFHLTGTPRFLDDIDWPPFHWYCRTSGALYLERYDDGITQRMRDSADIILAERARGRKKERHPASATI